MPTIIMKAEPESDLYMVWSTVVDGPVAAGTRAEMAEWMAREQPGAGDPEERLSRADATGTTGLFPGAGEWEQGGFVCNWTHDGMREVGPRWLPRRNIARWLRTGDESLLEPIDHDD